MDEPKVCYMEHKPCHKATRKNVYDNARKCKKITQKKCKENPTLKQSCVDSKKDISRLRKRELCTYIVSTPVFRSEGHVLQANFKKNKELRHNLSESKERQLFSQQQINMEKRDLLKIGDAQRTLYLAHVAGKDSIVYEERGGSKTYWTTFDLDEDTYLDDWELIFPSGFERYVRAARRHGIKHIFVYLTLYKQLEDDPDEISRHANFLLVDLEHSLLYRYESSGYRLYEVFDMDKLDRALTEWAKKRRLHYIPPWDVCPQVIGKVAAAQRKALDIKKEESEGGFCKTWATFMLEQKLRHPEMDMGTLQSKILQIFKDDNIDITNFGRKYTQRVNQFGNKILREHGMKSDENAEKYLEKHWKSLIKDSLKK